MITAILGQSELYIHKRLKSFLPSYEPYLKLYRVLVNIISIGLSFPAHKFKICLYHAEVYFSSVLPVSLSNYKKKLSLLVTCFTFIYVNLFI